MNEGEQNASGTSSTKSPKRSYRPLIWIGVGAVVIAVIVQVAVLSFALGRKTADSKAPVLPTTSPSPAPTNSATVDGNPEFVSLFNGQDLAGWDGDTNIWSVENGLLVGRTTQEYLRRGAPNNNLIWKAPVEDFELRLSFRMPQGNSGVSYRGQRLFGRTVGGYQFEIWGNNYGGLMDVGPDRTRRDLARVNKPQTYVRMGEWNEVVIIAQGNRLKHIINGVITADVTDVNPPARSGVLSIEAALSPKGILDIQFKDIRLKTLGPKPP